METKIVYGVKYYIEDIGTEFELFKTLSDAEFFWNNKSFDKIRPMKIIKGIVSKNAIIDNNNGEILLKKDFDFNGKPNRWAMHDCGLALENLLLEAVDLGLAAHPMAGFSADLVRSGYSVPEGYEPLVAVAVGYPGPSDMLEGALREREEDPRERKELSELVFSEAWGRSI